MYSVIITTKSIFHQKPNYHTIQMKKKLLYKVNNIVKMKTTNKLI